MIFKRLLIAVATIVATGSTLFAQVGFGPEVGLNGSAYNVRSGGVGVDAQARLGARIGAIADMAINENLYFQPGILYTGTGYKTNLPIGWEQYVINTIEVPLNLQYKIGMLGRDRFFVGAGVFAGYNRGGYYRRHVPAMSVFPAIDSRRNLNVGNWTADDINTFDFGFGANIGYQTTSGLFVRLRTQMGIINMRPGGTADNSIRSTSTSITFGYIFYRRHANGQLMLGRAANGKPKR